MRLLTEGKSELLELNLLDGGTRKIPLRVGDRDEGSFVHRRIMQAFQAYRARQGAGAIEALARGDQEPAEWLVRLRGLAAGANAGMRTAPVPVDRIWAVLDDPSAPAAARAGAAAALASGATTRDRERIRVAASAVAEPKLRVAIQKAAEESVDDQELAELLAEVEREGGRPADQRRAG